MDITSLLSNGGISIDFSQLINMLQKQAKCNTYLYALAALESVKIIYLTPDRVEKRPRTISVSNTPCAWSLSARLTVLPMRLKEIKRNCSICAAR